MIVDSSAIVAILRAEPDAQELARALIEAQVCRMSAVSYVEAGIAIDRNGDPVLSRQLDELIRGSNIIVESVTWQQAKLARKAYEDFGKGRHRARLNLGDSFTYALAKDAGEPLLFKGSDFGHTGIETVEIDS